ncbi:MAG: zinc-dependent alcohol dehydrogenase family protein [Oscillospiraceae bacterium]|nr:zinc-dependent alcohol dehydrogenase family protein [Oscillospiraceae bacterium]
MKAAVFYGAHDLRIEERAVPTPGRGELLIRVGACGVCGTDVHIFSGDEGAAKSPPGTVLGHEFAGEVCRVGEGVTAFRPGDRVCVDPNRICGTCDACRGGYAHFCERMVGYGTTQDGGFAEYCVIPESQAYRIPEGLPYARAAMAEPVACCLHGIDQCGIRPGDTVAVIGAGMIGLVMLQLARLSGAGKVIVLEPVERKRALACRLGADLAIDPTEGNAAEVIERSGVGRIGVVIECVGKTSAIRQALDIAGCNSTVMLFGLTAPDDEVAVKPFSLFKKEITLKTSYINPYTQSRAVTLIAQGRIDVSSMALPEVPLSELPAVLSDPARRAEGKFIVNPGL